MTDAQAYANCWNGFWTINEKDPQVWENANASVWSWKASKQGPYIRIKIPKRHTLKAKVCLGLPCAEGHDADPHDGYSSEE